MHTQIDRMEAKIDQIMEALAAIVEALNNMETEENEPMYKDRDPYQPL